MIWTKTDLGRREMQARSAVTDRQLRTLLLLIDGVKTEDMLMHHISGLAHDHFQALERMGMIVRQAPAPPVRTAPPAPPRAPTPAKPLPALTPLPPPPPVPPPRVMPVTPAPPVAAPARYRAPSQAHIVPGSNGLDVDQFTLALTELISRELGLKGFSLSLAVEKAATSDELIAVADQALDEIRARRGDAVADEAWRILFG